MIPSRVGERHPSYRQLPPLEPSRRPLEVIEKSNWQPAQLRTPVKGEGKDVGFLSLQSPQSVPLQFQPPAVQPRPLLPQSLPPHSLPPQFLPPQPLPPHFLPPQSFPPQYPPPPSQCLPPRFLPPQSLPGQFPPPSSLPPQSLPGQFQPPSSLPPQSLPSPYLPQSHPSPYLPPRPSPPQSIPHPNTSPTTAPNPPSTPKKKRPETDRDTRLRIQTLRDAAFTYSDIAKTLGVSMAQVQHACHTQLTPQRHKRGAKGRLSVQDRAALVAFVTAKKRSKPVSAPEIREHFKWTVSDDIIRRALRKEGISWSQKCPKAS